MRLIDAQSRGQLWAERYDVAPGNGSFLDVQDDVVRRVVSSVAGDTGALRRHRSREASQRGPDELSAYEAVLRSAHYSNVFTREAAVQARTALERATKVAPDYALAWAHLGVVLLDDETFGFGEVPNALERGAAAVERAVSLDPRSQFGRYAQAYACCAQGDVAGTIAAARGAIELNPSHAYLVGCAAFFLGMAGEFDESRAAFETARPMLPNPPDWWHLASYLERLAGGDYDAALAEADRIGAQNLYWRGVTRAAALGHLGRTAEARSEFAAAVREMPDLGVRPDRYVRRLVVHSGLVAQIVAGLPQLL